MGKPVDKTPVSTPQSTRLSKTDVPTPTKSTGSIITEQDLGRKKAFPLRTRHTEKFQLLNSGTWRKREPAGSIQAPLAMAPASVELLNVEGASKFNADGGLTDNPTLREGQPIPKEIIAVVRPKIILKENGEPTGRTDRQSIFPDRMEMNLEVKVLDFVPPDVVAPTAGPDMKVAYNARTTATRKQDVQGLYCFSTSGNELEHLFKQIGTYIFHYKIRRSAACPCARQRRSIQPKPVRSARPATYCPRFHTQKAQIQAHRVSITSSNFEFHIPGKPL